MITTNWLTVSPAYGRDYRSGKEASADFLSGKDFEMCSLVAGGKYCSVRDFAPGVSVVVRYKRLESSCTVKVPQAPQEIANVPTKEIAKMPTKIANRLTEETNSTKGGL